MDIVKLDLGCGDKKMAGYWDGYTCCDPDQRCDRSQFPRHWDDDYIAEVFSSHFLEHFLDYERTILEIHRILKPHAVFHFLVPQYRSPIAQWHLHHWPFSIYTPELFCQKRPYQWEGTSTFCQRKDSRKLSGYQAVRGFAAWLYCQRVSLFVGLGRPPDH